MEHGGKKNPQPPLVDRILQYGKLAFDPDMPEATKIENQTIFKDILQRQVLKQSILYSTNFQKSTGTLALIPVLNLLVQPGRTQPWLRAHLISCLATLPLRERGVQNTIEFILSVHPSSVGYNTSANAGKGSSISHEALNAASRLLSSPPGGMSPDKWFSGIAPQLFSLLQGDGEPEMDRAAAFIIGFGILGRKQFGAPGMPGWKAFVEPIIGCIDPTLVFSAPSITIEDSEIVKLGNQNVLVSSEDLAKSLQRLSSLVTSHPHPSLTKRLLAPILLPLWSLSSWSAGEEFGEDQYRKPATMLLKTFLQLSSFSRPTEAPSQPSSPQNLEIIVKNLTFRGRSDATRLGWTYVPSGHREIQVTKRHSNENSILSEGDLQAIDHATTAFVTLIDSLPELNAEISQLFMSLCRKWLTDENASSLGPVLTHTHPGRTDGEMESRLIEVKVMQSMMIAIPGKLVDDSRQVLELVNQVLTQFINADGNEDTISVALSLLNIVLTSASFQETSQNEAILKSIKASLTLIGKRATLEGSSTAQNLLLLLRFRKMTDEPTNLRSTTTDQQAEDRKSYSLALSYLTTIDSPPPVRAHGLELISDLIKANSSILDIPALLVLFSSLLQDSDEYIYLRVIKSFIELSQKHPKASMKDLIERYVDSNEDADLDQRLRFGEALLQVILNSGLEFTGDISRSVCEGLLSIAGRRGYRPKSEKDQEKRNRLKRKKDQDAEEAWGGEVPQFEDQMTPENEFLAQIVSGWESKRGMEDVRIRASALSILGSAIELNIGGIGSTLVSATVDLSIHILTLEPEPEKGILRRSAILLVMSFVRALDEARTEGRKLGFGFVGQSLDDVQRILKYVEDTDNDGLVRQHAKDVVESLQTWQINSLLPAQHEQVELQELAGLSIKPGTGHSNSRARPRIEEIE